MVSILLNKVFSFLIFPFNYYLNVIKKKLIKSCKKNLLISQYYYFNNIYFCIQMMGTKLFFNIKGIVSFSRFIHKIKILLRLQIQLRLSDED